MRHWSYLCLLLSLLAGPVCAGDDGPGHVHGPDGRHLPSTPGPAEVAGGVLSHHDLEITDSRRMSPRPDGRVPLAGAVVESTLFRRGKPEEVIHRERNAYEPEAGVYGAHYTYRSPGEYTLREQVTLPDGAQHTLEFPVWVPGEAAAARGAMPPWLMVLAGAGGGCLLLGVFLLGRVSGRRAAARLGVLLVVGLAAPLRLQAQEEHGHAHGPDGRHLPAGAASPSGEPGGLPAFLGPSGELEAVLERPPYRFRLRIENEALTAPDPDLVVLTDEAARMIGLQLATATRRPVGSGLSVTGQVRPNPQGQVVVNARVAGRVVSLPGGIGQEVRAGDPLAVLESPDVEAAQAAWLAARSEVRQSRLAVERAGAEVRRLEALAQESESSLAQARAERQQSAAARERLQRAVELAQTRARGAQDELARVRALAETGAFAQGPLEEARAALATEEAELRSARASLAQSEAQAARLEQGLRVGVTARREVDAARTQVALGMARVTAAEQRATLAREALAREERIRRESLRDAREVQQARSAADSAASAVRVAETELQEAAAATGAAEEQIRLRERSLQAARAAVRTGRTEVAVARAHVAGDEEALAAVTRRLRLLGALPGGGSRVTVAAPLPGHIHERAANLGHTLAVGEPILTLVNTGTVWIEAGVFDRHLPRVRMGQSVSVTTPAAPGRTFRGVVSYLGDVADPQSRAVPVRAVLENPAGVLRAGTFVQVQLGGEGTTAVTIPRAAVQEQGARSVVFVAEAESAYRLRSIRTGATFGDWVVVEEGLKAGERVVVQGAYQLLARAGS